MLKKAFVIVDVCVVLLFLICVCALPGNGAPIDLFLDQQIKPLIPGDFQLIDSDRDGQADLLKFTLAVQVYQEGSLIVTGNLEGKKDGDWLALATSVITFPWTPKNNKIELTFQTGNIIKHKISGSYRVMVAIKAGEWELPTQIAGFSPKYAWTNFAKTERIGYGEITAGSEAQRAAETWAEYNDIKLGKLIEINFDYDHWQVDYQGKTGEVLRFQISPVGTVDLQKIKA